jgi:hypothetical protein
MRLAENEIKVAAAIRLSCLGTLPPPIPSLTTSSDHTTLYNTAPSTHIANSVAPPPLFPPHHPLHSPLARIPQAISTKTQTPLRLPASSMIMSSPFNPFNPTSRGPTSQQLSAINSTRRGATHVASQPPNVQIQTVRHHHINPRQATHSTDFDDLENSNSFNAPMPPTRHHTSPHNRWSPLPINVPLAPPKGQAPLPALPPTQGLRRSARLRPPGDPSR